MTYVPNRKKKENYIEKRCNLHGFSVEQIKKSESRTGVEAMTFHTLIGCFSHALLN